MAPPRRTDGDETLSEIALPPALGRLEAWLETMYVHRHPACVVCGQPRTGPRAADGYFPRV
jgi:hypothetical protein